MESQKKEPAVARLTSAALREGNLGYGKLGVGSSHGGFAPEGELFVPLEGTPRFPVTETDPGDLEVSLVDGKEAKAAEAEGAGQRFDEDAVDFGGGDSVILNGGLVDNDDDNDDDDLEMETYDSDVYTDDEDDDEEEKQRLQQRQQLSFPRLTRKERHFLIYLRKQMNHMNSVHVDRGRVVELTNEELSKCRRRIAALEADRDATFAAIERAEGGGGGVANRALADRLHRKHAKICREIEAELNLEEKVQEVLRKVELEFFEIDIEKGIRMLDEIFLEENEIRLKHEEIQDAQIRVLQEHGKRRMADKRLEEESRRVEETMKERAMRQIADKENAKQAHDKHRKHFVNTLDTLNKEKESIQSQRRQEHTAKMESVMKLKKDIDLNRTNLKAIAKKRHDMEEKARKAEEEEKERIARSGGNPDLEILRRRDAERLEAARIEFEAEQRIKQMTITQSLLDEEEEMERRKKRNPWLFPPDEKTEKAVAKTKETKKKSKLPKSIVDELKRRLEEEEEVGGERGGGKVTLPPIDGNGRGSAENGDEERICDLDGEDQEEEAREENGVGDREGMDEGEEPGEAGLEGVDGVEDLMAQPEFEGMWESRADNKLAKKLKAAVAEGNAVGTQFAKSKMDVDILNKVLARHREGVIRAPVLPGKKLKGAAPFYSRPGVVEFKDFLVGKTYSRKVVLTNVSYSINYCKYERMTDILKDFLEISFSPPGQMSAGLTCDLVVTFKPKINEDVEGHLFFLSQTGPFTIPVRCLTKKCELSIEADVDFGTTVVGETLYRTITLKNDGALSTNFDLKKFGDAGVTDARRVGATTGGAPPSAGDRPFTRPGTSAGTKVVLAGEDGEITDVGGGDGDNKGAADDDAATEVPTERASTDAGADGVGLETEAGKSMGSTKSRLSARSKGGRDASGGGGGGGISAAGEDPLDGLDGLRVEGPSSGEIKSFSSVQLQICFAPTIAGQMRADFEMSFADPLSSPILIQASGNAIDVPVWMEKQTLDMKICMFDRLFQDSIVVRSRASTALKIKFELPQPLANHMEILPKSGYIQAGGGFSAQLKFLPRPSMAEDVECQPFYDVATSVMEVPVTVRVAEQTRPVSFSVHAVVTNSDLEFDAPEVDFGPSTIYESVTTAVKLTNKSMLPQEFGFIGIPDFIDIQPGDGFGTLLPFETVTLDVIFSPARADDFKFNLICKTLIDREFRLSCRGIGVHPPLRLSSHEIHFRATALYDSSTVSLHVHNDHVSSNVFSFPVPRIGTGDVFPVGPTTFEFVIPPNAPISICPLVGTVSPGQKLRATVLFQPRLPSDVVMDEAITIALKAAEAKREMEEAMSPTKDKDDLAKKKKGKEGKGSPKGKSSSAAQSQRTTPGPDSKGPSAQSIDKNSDEYAQALSMLLTEFRPTFESFTIPCYIANGDSRSRSDRVGFNVENTLYLKVFCPTIRPPLMVTSDNGRTNIDFEEVSIGQRVTKSFTIQNISDEELDLSTSILDPGGPFMLLNALNPLEPGESLTLLICFTPAQGRVFQETLKVYCPYATLSMTLRGCGVTPEVSVFGIDENGVVDMGYCICNEFLTQTFKIQNNSSLSINFAIHMESQNLERHRKLQKLPPFTQSKMDEVTLVGTQNLNGTTVFDCVPAEGEIPAGGFREITVKFEPDHASDHYSDVATIQLFGQQDSTKLRFRGVSKEHTMYVVGGEPLLPSTESLGVEPVVEEDSSAGGKDATDGPKVDYHPVLLLFRSSIQDGVYTPCAKEIQIGLIQTQGKKQMLKQSGDKPKSPAKGAIKTTAGQKKSGEFSFDNLAPFQSRGFSIDAVKGVVDSGAKKAVTITWSPTVDIVDPKNPLEGVVILNVKGDVAESFKIICRGIVVTE